MRGQKRNEIVMLDDNKAKRFRQELRDKGYTVYWNWFRCDGRNYVLIEWK